MEFTRDTVSVRLWGTHEIPLPHRFYPCTSILNAFACSLLRAVGISVQGWREVLRALLPMSSASEWLNGRHGTMCPLEQAKVWALVYVRDTRHSTK